MRDDYCDYFDYIQYKYDLSDRTCDIHEKINIVLNFIAIIALTIIAYIYKINFGASERCIKKLSGGV